MLDHLFVGGMLVSPYIYIILLQSGFKKLITKVGSFITNNCIWHAKSREDVLLKEFYHHSGIIGWAHNDLNPLDT